MSLSKENKMSGKDDSQYFFLKAPEDHVDLHDIFQGKYIKSRQQWRFDKTQEAEVSKFMECTSSDESDHEPKYRHKHDRLHRANSFNASDSSEEDCESIDGKYRRKRPSRKKILKEISKLKADLKKLELKTEEKELQGQEPEK
jgi:hypothetical protein